ncbi:histidine kinase dimerization/phospho-acceptor domain-containing protein, partial [Neisseria gonorrhoeae]|uniref:histidine kinase dimerization/phospho-acceptor domain-containing protein n=1 Tax=Neisseria gonorrhoeae TaxID=485 RepID=UPI00384DD4E9
LAHEIRNPLTPIQLSAERLAWKLGGKLDDQDAQILTRSTDTITTPLPLSSGNTVALPSRILASSGAAYSTWTGLSVPAAAPM